MYDIVFLSNNNSTNQWNELKTRFPLAKKVDSFEKARKVALTDFFWLVPDDIIIDKKFDFDYVVDEWSSDYVHVFKNKNFYDGIALIPKHVKITTKEVEHRFYVNKKEVDVVASMPKPYDLFFIDSYRDYKTAYENSSTEMFWMSSNMIVHDTDLVNNYYISHHDSQLRNQTHAFVHKVDEHRLYNGLFLCSKRRELSEREVEYRFPVNRIEHDTVGSTKKPYSIVACESYDEYLAAIDNPTITELFWTFTPNVKLDPGFKMDLYFTHDNEYDRKSNHNFIHRVDGKDYRNGVFLLTKHRTLTQREFEHRFIVNAKEWDVVASGPVEYPVYEIDSYEEYVSALERSPTEMFWMSSKNITANIPDLYFTHDNEYDRKRNHNFWHCGDKRNGLFLCSKHVPLTEREVEYRFVVNAKEWDIEASGPKSYDIFEIDSYDDYLYALENSSTEMFWGTSCNLTATIPDLYFTHDNEYDRKSNHNFWHHVKDKFYRNGVFLFSKHSAVTEKEIQHRFIVNAKEWDIVVSTPVEYDVFNIETYDDYQFALKNSKTELFWATSHNINYQIPDLYFTHDNEYDRKSNHTFIHVVKDKNLRNGLFLLSKHRPLTAKEIDHRFIVNAKEWDIIGSTSVMYPVYEIDTYDEYLQALENTQTEMFWMSSRNITADIPDLYFTHDNEYDRKQNHAFIHRVGDQDLYNGLFLCSKHRPLTQKEVEFRHIVNRKEWDIVGSGPVQYDVFVVDNYEDYLNAYDNTTTEMFWATSNNIGIAEDFKFDIYFTHDNEYDRKQNHAFIHRVQGEDLYNGLYLLSKHRPLTKKEVDHKFILNRKEWDTVASGPCKYEIFYPKTYEDYLAALKNSKTEMFWIVPDYVDPAKRFAFDTYFSHDKTYDRTINHAFLNGKYHDGIVLCSKAAKFSKREFEYKFISAKKEVNIVISTPKPYDIVFISYQEPNADENYADILKRFPNTKRIHGVKGIHQAHIEAAKLCDTDMFWIVDGDATIVNSFNFRYQVARWDKETVHVWRSQNPINDMVYGYGGVKLFPTELTVNMDTSKPDMTTSISSKFRAVNEISNITGFNTDPFNTWKSAFRECTKLASKVIDRQKDQETDERLRIWQTVGGDKMYGKYALLGAKMGTEYGKKNQDNIEALKKINDFDWLLEQFNGNT
jgi:CYTH domain-containing protein